jgi:Na+-transporting methylmalonyl-CoA/oxaloacetate decarboxylase gamma subunit
LVFTILGLAGLAAFLSTRWNLVGLGVAVVFLFLAGTAFSNATQIAKAIRRFVKESVRVEVWGAALPASGAVIFEIVSISAFGAGLLIRLRATPGGPALLLKVAQPRAARLEEGRIEISEAAYVSWAGTRIKAAAGTKMPALVLLTVTRHPYTMEV